MPNQNLYNSSYTGERPRAIDPYDERRVIVEASAQNVIKADPKRAREMLGRIDGSDGQYAAIAASQAPSSANREGYLNYLSESIVAAAVSVDGRRNDAR